jgi:hypothetical protein
MGVQIDDEDLSVPLIRDSVQEILTSAEAIPEDADAALIGVAKRGEWNAAFLLRSHNGWHVKAWVGQEKGERFDYGVGVLKTFKF